MRRLPISLAALALLAIACGAPATDEPEEAPAPSKGSPAPPSTATGTSTSTPPSPPAATSCAGKIGAKGDRELTVTSAGRTVKVDLHAPPSYDATKATSLVLAFHGYLMTPDELRETTHLAEAADAKNFLVAFPAGLGKSWNGGDCCGDASSKKLDDEAVARAIVTNIAAEYCVDPKRVFATGFSNGGFLSHRLACSASDVFAAIASVSGVMGIDPASCKPSRAVPVLQIHGTSDNVVPYNGGRSLFLGPEYRSVAKTISAWREKDTCPATSITPYSKGAIKCEAWDACAKNASVQLCTVDGGSHAWPGGSGSNGSSSTWKATDAIVDFFAAHPMP